MQTIEAVISKYAKDIKEIIAKAAHDVRPVQAQQMSSAFEKIAVEFGAAPAAVKPAVQRLRQGFMDAVHGRPVHGAEHAPFAKAAAKQSAKLTKSGRRKGPIQLCPVPKCKNRAAPVYGMVCKTHRLVSKKLIAKYREARRKKAK